MSHHLHDLLVISFFLMFFRLNSKLSDIKALSQNAQNLVHTPSSMHAVCIQCFVKLWAHPVSTLTMSYCKPRAREEQRQSWSHMESQQLSKDWIPESRLSHGPTTLGTSLCPHLEISLRLKESPSLEHPWPVWESLSALRQEVSCRSDASLWVCAPWVWTPRKPWAVLIN